MSVTTVDKQLTINSYTATLHSFHSKLLFKLFTYTVLV